MYRVNFAHPRWVRRTSKRRHRGWLLLFRDMPHCGFPHSFDQVQALGRGKFAVHELESRRVRPQGELTKQTRKIIKIFAGWEKASTQSSVVSAFRRAGIFPIWVAEAGTLVCHVDLEQTTQVRHWSRQKSHVHLDQGTHLK
jgi:hypothetical protein